MRLKLALFVFSSLLLLTVNGHKFESLSIGILTPHHFTSIQVIPEQGTYQLIVSGASKSTIKPGERITFIARGNLVEVRLGKVVIGKYKSPRLMASTDSSYFRLYTLQPRKMERMYDDDLHLLSSASGLKMINHVGLEKYVAGVVESETGKGQTKEFYKVQAVISRTYALNNRRKHLFEGFNLNDQVDCQVYHGKSRWEPLILDAVHETRGKVLVDSDMKMITAAFHSNSGGETVGSQSVWSAALPYLTPRVDEFSVDGNHYHWEKIVHKEKWLDYLKDKYKLNTSDTSISNQAINYVQSERDVFFIDPKFSIPLKELRMDWRLRSTYFDINPQGSDSLKIVGRGFGHGIGLSQEGAMRMADLGFSFVDVLHFYYNDVHVIELNALDFFQND